MTQDFKDKILKYLTGNLEEQTGTNEPQFQATQTITNNLYQYTMDNFDVSGQQSPYIIDIIKSNKNNNYLCYGNGYNFGFMIILDSNFQVIESTSTYTSGTTMRQFQILKQSQNGSFYGVDYVESGNNISYRFLILNNVLLKTEQQTNYQFVMKRTYNFPSAYSTISALSFVSDIIKNENGGQYLICGNYLNSNNDYNCIAIELVIQVGQSNQWNEYKQNVEDGKIYYISGSWCSWDSQDNISILISCSVNNVIYVLQNSGSSLTTLSQYTISTNVNVTVYKMVILNSTLFYVLAQYYDNQTDDGITYIYMIKNNIISLIYQSDTYTTIVGNVKTWGLTTDYINTYFWYATMEGNDYSYYGGLIIGENVYTTLIQTVDNIYSLSLQVSFNQYNLYSFNLQSANTLYTVPFVFNQYNYNGQAYENINSLLPNSGIIYDENGNIIFARNLYNLNVNGATTISTIEVPNTFLNDTTLAEQDLISQTNGILNQEINSITKNIYENLDINFFNTLIMKNANNGNEIINYNGANRLNNSISSALDYSNALANKIKINYDDETTDIKNIGTPTITNGVATYTISIYVPKTISSIEIMSSDLETSYQTITGTFNIGSYYTITQDVRVE